MADRSVDVDDVNFIITPRGGVEDLVLHLDADDGRIELPLALTADRAEDGRITEMRIYFSNWPLTGGHAVRPPVLQPDPDLHEADASASASARSRRGTPERPAPPSSRAGTGARRPGGPLAPAARRALPPPSSCSSPTA